MLKTSHTVATVMPFLHRIRFLEVKKLYNFYVLILLCLIMSIPIAFVGFMAVQQAQKSTFGKLFPEFRNLVSQI